eukprot:Nitzschia sp. Nitz4//scaffold11_size288233//18932//19585//NITZ4_000730-RA/size288233-processed-gene-0.200-mRNA-1//-1//CDS//3329533942//5633//frame0
MTTTASLPRQRRGRSPTPHVVNNSTIPDDDKETTEFLDSDDQRALIATLRAEAQTHQRQLQRAFVVLGGTGSFLSLIFPWLCPEECSIQPMRCWIHALMAALLHVSSIAFVGKNTTTDRLQRFQFGILEVSTLVAHLWCLLMCIVVGLGHDSSLLWLGAPSSSTTQGLSTEMNWFHVGLCAGNLVTYMGAWLLQWDARSTSQALQELQQAQYDHKTL